MGKIIDGSSKAAEIKNKLRTEILNLKEKGIIPGLATILIGENPGSIVYVNMKQKACRAIGIHSEKISFPMETSPTSVLKKIQDLNSQESIHGILIQLPVPPEFQDLIQRIDPLKDVDGFHSQNIGRLATGDENETLVSCTPLGILTLLEDLTTLRGKNIVIINHSVVVGRPLALLLLNREATVTVCHEFTENLKQYVLEADIIITAVGIPHLIKKDMVKPGAIVIDAGFSRVDGKIMGDVDFDAVKEIASHITPPTGGVGPMTIAMLLQNTVKATKRIHELQ